MVRRLLHNIACMPHNTAIRHGCAYHTICTEAECLRAQLSVNALLSASYKVAELTVNVRLALPITSPIHHEFSQPFGMVFPVK